MEIPTYNPQEWRLFLDSLKVSLKCVFLHNGNSYASIPIGHSTTLKEQYQSIKIVLQKLAYEQHQWHICVDFRMVNFLLGQQAGYTKFSYFLCLWDSRVREEHWVKKDWPLRRTMSVGASNIINEQLVSPDNIILHPLHLKLGLMKQYVKAFNKHGDCFKYICRKFPGLSIEKLKQDIFNGPQIRQLINDSEFVNSMTELEFSAWNSFVLVVKNFLGNFKTENYKLGNLWKICFQILEILALI